MLIVFMNIKFKFMTILQKILILFQLFIDYVFY